jgi:plasmid stabilization system protein ParE
MKIVWSDRAILHLEKIRQYLLEQDAPEAARRVMARLIETPEALLSDFPRLGRRVEEPGFEAYHELLVLAVVEKRVILAA